MGADCVADFRFLLILFGQFHAEQSVGEFRLVVGHFAYVMQQTGAAGLFGVPSSEAITAHRLAVSRACCSRF